MEILDKIIEQDPTNNYWQQDLSAIYVKLGEVLRAAGDLEGAKAQYRRALEISQKLAGKERTNSDSRYGLAICYKDLGVLLKQQGDIEGARQNLRAALDVLTYLLKLRGGNPNWKADIDFVKTELGE